MARNYVDSWSTDLSTSSAPYRMTSATSVAATASGGYLYIPNEPTSSYINAIVRGTPSAGFTDADNYSGDFVAIQFNALLDSMNPYCEFIASTADTDRSSTQFYLPMLLMYGYANHLLAGWAPLTGNTATPSWAGSNPNGGTGNFDLNTFVTTQGTEVKIVVIRKKINSTSSYLAMAVTNSLGATVRTGWSTQRDTTGHIYLRFANTHYYSSPATSTRLSAISVADQLTDAQANSILAAGDIDYIQKPVFSVGTSNKDSAFSLALTAPTLIGDVAYSIIRYTTDGTDPIASSPAYSAPITVGAPFTPGTSITVKAAYFTPGGLRASVASNTYTFKVFVPVPSIYANNTNPYPTAGSNFFTDDVPVTWSSTAPAGVDYWYTVDGSEPAVSGTAVKWATGSKVPFNSSPTLAGIQTMNYCSFRYAAHDTTCNAWSASAAIDLNFLLSFDGNVATSNHGGFLSKETTLTWSAASFTGVVAPIATTTTVVINGVSQDFAGSAGSTVIPFIPNVDVVVSVTVKSNDGLLKTNAAISHFTFMQFPPILAKNKIITGAAQASVGVINPNGASSVLHYTLDGTVPTESSPILLTADIDVAQGNTLSIIAVRQGVLSSVATCEIVSECAVDESITVQLEGESYHYYTVTRMTELNSPLGEADDYPITLPAGTNANTDTVPATIDLAPASIYLWDTATIGGAINGFPTTLKVQDIPTNFWSRLSYREAAFRLDYNFLATDWMSPIGLDGNGFPKVQMHGPFTMFRLVLGSRLAKFTFDYVVDCDTKQTTIVCSRKLHGQDAVTIIESIPGAVITSGSGLNNYLSITIKSPVPDTSTDSISVSDGTGTSTVTLTDEMVGLLWYVEGAFNPNSTDIPTTVLTNTSEVSASMAVLLTVNAAEGVLRRAPATVFAETTSTSDRAPRTKHYDLTKSADRGAFDVYLPSGALNVPADTAVSQRTGALEILGPFELKIPGSVNPIDAFDVTVDVATYMETAIGQTTTAAGQYIALYAIAKGSSAGSDTTIGSGTAYTMFRSVPEIDQSGAAIANSMSTEFYAGTLASKVVVQTANTRVRLRLVKDAGTALTRAYGYFGDTEISLGSFTSITGATEFRLVRYGQTRRATPMRTDLMSVDVAGSKNIGVFTSVAISGAHIMYKGQATWLNPSSLTNQLILKDKIAYAVYLDNLTHNAVLEPIGYEPADGRLLIGILDLRDDNLLWTNLLFSSTVRMRTAANVADMQAGVIIGAGSAIAASKGKLTWKSAGGYQETLIGDDQWHTPNVYIDVFRKKQIIKVTDIQPIKLSLSNGR